MDKLKKLVSKTVVGIAAVTLLTTTLAVAQSGGSGSGSGNPCGTGSHLCGYDPNGNPSCCEDGTRCCDYMGFFGWVHSCLTGNQTC